MKRSTHLRLALMASLPAVLTACDNPAITGQPQALAPADCSTAERLQGEACQAELERLVETSARYGSREDCEQGVGGECEEVDSGGQRAWIGPTTGFLTGYLLRDALDRAGDRYERRRRAGGYAGGYRDGYRTPPPVPATTAPPPDRAITQSRSGFGSSASARSSFRGGWGG